MATRNMMEEKIKSPLGKELIEALSENKQIIDKVLEREPEADKPDRNKKHNIMLVNLDGFIQMVSKMSPEDTDELQKNFYSVINSSVSLYKGLIIKNIGYAYLITAVDGGLPGELRGFRFDAPDEPFAEIELDSMTGEV